jgi:hypothetical protein
MARFHQARDPDAGVILASMRTVVLSIILAMALGPVGSGAATQDEEFPRQAEPWAPSFESPMRSVFTEPLMLRIAEWFAMTDDQRILLAAIEDDHKARFDSFVAEHEPTRYELDKAWWDLRVDPPAQLAKAFEREEVLAKMADQQEQTDMLFLEDLRAILNEEQLERWDAFEQWLVRERWLRRSAPYLEQPIDLIALLDELRENHPNTEIASETIEEYAGQIDESLRELARLEISFSRNRVRANADRHRTDGERVWLDGDAPEVRETIEKRNAVQKRVRDLNRTYSQTIAANLEEPFVGDWRRLYRAAVLRNIDVTSALPDETNEVIRSLQTGPDINRLMSAMETAGVDLDADQADMIGSILNLHEQALHDIFMRLVRAHDAVEESRFSRINRDELARLNEEYLELLQSLADGQKTVADRVVAVLTPEQRTALEQVESTDAGDDK